MLGTIVNALSVLAGGGLGVVLRRRIPERMREIAMQAIGLVTLVLGMQMALGTHDILVVILSVVLGGWIGEAVGIEAGLERLGAWAETRLGSAGERGTFARAFVTSSLLFCVGPLTAFSAAFRRASASPPTLLYTKSVLDGVSSLAIGAALGLGVLLSARTILVYQGALTLLAQAAQAVMTPDVTPRVHRDRRRAGPRHRADSPSGPFSARRQPAPGAAGGDRADGPRPGARGGRPESWAGPVRSAPRGGTRAMAVVVEPVELIGEHVALAPMEEAHLDGLCDAGRSPEIWPYMPMQIGGRDDMARLIRDALRARDQGAELPFVIRDRRSGRIVGSTRFLDITPAHRNVEIGWTWLDPAVWRTSINTECKYLLTRYCFDTLEMIRVRAEDRRPEHTIAAGD